MMIIHFEATLTGKVLDVEGVENFRFLAISCQNIQGLVIFSSYQWKILLLEMVIRF